MISNLKIFPTPSKLVLPHAGSKGTDTNFKSVITRLTDSNTEDNFTLMTADSGVSNLWNKDSTMLIVNDTGGRALVIDLKTLKTTGFTSGRAITWSRVNNNVIYGIEGLSIVKHVFKNILGIWKWTSTTVMVDFTSLLPAGFVPMSYTNLSCSKNDRGFAFGVSNDIQDTAHFVLSYCNGLKKLLDTSLGPKPFLIHEVYQSLNSEFVSVGHIGTADPTLGIGPLIWDVLTGTLTPSNASGHFIGGMNLMVHDKGAGQWGSLDMRDPANTKKDIILASHLPAASGQALLIGSHGSWNNNIDDTQEFVVSTGGIKYGQQTPYPCALFNEVLGYDIVNGIINRYCHTRNSCKSPYFIAQNAIAVANQATKLTGTRVAFTSDMMGTLGLDRNNNPRSDVFQVQL